MFIKYVDTLANTAFFNFSRRLSKIFRLFWKFEEGVPFEIEKLPLKKVMQNLALLSGKHNNFHERLYYNMELERSSPKLKV